MASVIGLTSLLFVPGAAPQRFAKALASGASVACIDLEDSVAEEGKQDARDAAIAAVAADPRLAVRINPVTTPAGLRDLIAIADGGAMPALVLLAKAESPGDIAVVRGTLGEGAKIVPLIESPAALAQTAAIAAAPGVAAMMFGGGDMAAELGTALAWEPLRTARGVFLLGCAQAGAPTIDVPYLDLDDTAGLDAETQLAKALGFQAKAAIHPGQIATINAALRPSADLLAEARDAQAAFDAAGGAATRFRGRMLELPVMRRYRRILAQATGEELIDA
ncbi:MAG: CoA ester lyase [Sphingomonas sp. 28-66-16]|nr:MAG: CoA ester lyase [Sphingomonas sp. 28-66-16]